MKLSAQLVANKTKTDHIESVQSLNAWGNHLKDVSILKRMPRLKVLSLSVNNIPSLRDFAGLTELEELYLRDNKVTDINEVRYLTRLPKLRKLSLSANPCSESPDYRSIVSSSILTLEELDGIVVTDGERMDKRLLLDDAALSLLTVSETSTAPDSLSEDIPIDNSAALRTRKHPFVPTVRLPTVRTRGPFKTRQVPSMKIVSRPTLTTSSNKSSSSMENPRASPNMVYAVFSLLRDCDAQSLALIKSRVCEQLEAISQ